MSACIAVGQPAFRPLAANRVEPLGGSFRSVFLGRYDLAIGMTLEGLCICVITIFVIKRPTTLPGKTLNSAVLRHIGVISYSLYLWQNIFTGYTSQYFPFNLLAVLACAELSYWFVERPSLALRDRLEKKSMGALALS
jgi:peptidoglycan/LPS O-acetylase OafA/YrhL